MQKNEIGNRIEEITSTVDRIVGEFKVIPEKDVFKDITNNDFHNEIIKLVSDLTSARKKFDAKKYFIVCLGAVKAGKSTLLNALTEKFVSPYGAGIETTKRSSIILSAEKDHPAGITLYRTKVESTDYIKDLLSYFQETKSWDELKKSFHKSSPPLALNEENLKETLTETNLKSLSNFNDACLVEIRVNVQEDSILNNKVAFIDMPGIDGYLAGIEKNPTIKEIPQECHHLLWVQSSVSALNNTTYERLREFFKNKSYKIPVYGILNIMNAKAGWYTEKAIAEELEEQETDIEKRWNKLLQAGDRKIEKFRINAAKAWDAFNFDKIKDKINPSLKKENLIKESYIEYLKSEISKKVGENKEDILRHDALKSLIELCKKLSDKTSPHSIIEYKKQIEAKLQKDSDTKGELGRQREKYHEKFDSKSQMHSNSLKHNLAELLKQLDGLLTAVNRVECGDAVPGNCHNDKQITKDEYVKMLRDWMIQKDKTFEDKIKEYSNKSFDDIAKKLAEQFTSLRTEILDYISDSENEIVKSIKNDIQNCTIDKDEIIERLKGRIFYDKNDGEKLLPSMLEFYQDEKSFDVELGSWRLGQKFRLKNFNRNKNEVNKHADNLFTNYVKKLSDRLNEQGDFIRAIKKTSSKLFEEEVTNLRTQITNLFKKEITKLEKHIGEYTTIINEIENIQKIVKKDIQDKCEVFACKLER
ncbi:MAG: hypothetical protein E7056_03220 [Lentisphaerae bacterium]|nr:hypothetical protein [Lentisphaerota bacterium]